PRWRRFSGNTWRTFRDAAPRLWRRPPAPARGPGCEWRWPLQSSGSVSSPPSGSAEPGTGPIRLAGRTRAAGSPAPPHRPLALDPKDIPADLLAAAGGGDPKKAPRELVAVLGEDKHQGQTDQPCHLYAVAISPDGKTLASAGTDKVVRLWDLATGKIRRELTGHRQPDV